MYTGAGFTLRSARIRESASSERCPPESSERDSFHLWWKAICSSYETMGSQESSTSFCDVLFLGKDEKPPACNYFSVSVGPQPGTVMHVRAYLILLAPGYGMLVSQ